MSWERRRNVSARPWRPRRNRAAGRFRFPFWAGWIALIAGGVTFHLVSSATIWPGTGQGATYQCRRNAYNCSDFRTRFEAQGAYLACGGSRNDVHRLDDDRDGLACEYLPLMPWFGGS